MLLDGLALGGYRSFGAKPQFIGPLAQINVFIGPNNCGKSNILRFLSEHYDPVVSSLTNANPAKSKAFTALDRPIGPGPIPFVIGIARHESELIAPHRSLQRQEMLKLILKSVQIPEVPSIAWFEFESKTQGERPTLDYLKLRSRLMEIPGLRGEQDWYGLWRQMNPQRSGGALPAWFQQVIDTLFAAAIRKPNVAMVPAIREVRHIGDADHDLSGLGLVHRLARLQNPAQDERHQREKFDDINAFVQTVTQNANALLEVPYKRDEILVHMDDKTLPLSSLGTGLHEVIILAVAATVTEGSILCIEEPEIHLHPRLQRELLAYLASKTDNQYFLTTHSAHLLDVADAAIFRVHLESGFTIIERAVKPFEKRRICDDLGYRASDLLQSNCVIWVEGPSDRVYLNHWIRAVDPSLVEAVNYSIMFYGGRLLNHLSANDAEVKEFISLRALNRNLVVVIDSDRKSKTAQINPTKQRIAAEFDKPDGGFAWVTDGREIENYIPREMLSECVEAVQPGFGGKVDSGQHKNVLPFVDASKRRRVDKVKVAHEVANRAADLSKYDLRSRIEQLIEFIRTANHLAPLPATASTGE